MTPKEKAKELVDKFYNAQIECLNKIGITELEEVELSISKQSALIAVNEIIASIPTLPNDSNKLEKTTAIMYWVNVKTELENL